MIVGDVEGNTKGVVVTVFERVNPFYICRLVYRTVEASVIKGQRVFFLYKKQFCGDAVVVGLAEDVPVHIVVQPKISAVAEVQDEAIGTVLKSDGVARAGRIAHEGNVLMGHGVGAEVAVVLSAVEIPSAIDILQGQQVAVGGCVHRIVVVMCGLHVI